MMRGAGQRLGNGLLAVAVGVSSFLFTLAALLHLTAMDHKIAASIGLGLFALMVCWVAAERPNSLSARANQALAGRLLQVCEGDLTSPAPRLVHHAMPGVGRAVDDLFARVRASIDEAQAAALIDGATGLPNRVHFRREVERMLEARAGDAACAMMFVDLDRFKAINDNLGHARGDEALGIVAERLRAVAASEGEPRPLVARLGGDEFTLFFPELSGADDAARIAARVLAALAEPFEIRGHAFDIGASVGVAMCPEHGCDLATLMRASDLAMYQAKSSGRGRVCLFDDGLATAFEARTATEIELRNAIANGDFALFFRPQAAFDDGEIVAVEALLRWRHPCGGVRPPSAFMSVAEECGLIIDIDDWLIDAVGGTLAGWRRAGIATRLTIGVSPRQLDRSQFLARLRAAFTRAGADLNQLELEFEDIASIDLDTRLIRELEDLRRDGVRIAISGFGAGSSNIAQLKRMPLDRITIDHALTREVEFSEDARTIVQALVQLVQGLNCDAVAQGVESAEQAELLRLIGLDMLHNHAPVEPMTGPELLDRLASRAPAAAGDMRAITAA